jgi:hypothetical protein
MVVSCALWFFTSNSAGLLLGFLGSAIARGEWRGILAVALLWFVLWRKLKFAVVGLK